jgi:L-threonylcarbamoyladenylate synthase
MIKEIQQAAQTLKSGGLVAFPTETVYGLGADALNPEAVSQVFLAKGRPFGHPLIVHLSDIKQLEQWARDISSQALTLAQHFWPGPLTLVFNKQKQVLDEITGSQETIGLRIPSHAVAQALLKAFGGGIAAPSANRFTRLSPTTAAAVYEELGDKVDVILDGGTCAVGLESTIVDVSSQQVKILRPGMISSAMISEVLGQEVLLDTQSHIKTPGRHMLHYAPMTPVLIVSIDEMNDVMRQFKNNHESAVCLSRTDVDWPEYDVIRMPQQPQSYAQALYHTLRGLDQRQFQRIVIESVPDTTAWEAIRDRLNKSNGGRYK